MFQQPVAGSHELMFRYYASNPVWTDGTTQFRAMIEPRLSPSARVLDVGAGSGRDYKFPYSGKVSRLVGIDLGQEVLENPFLDEAYCCDAAQMPFAAASFDLAFSDYVFEHLAQPRAVLDE